MGIPTLPALAPILLLAAVAGCDAPVPGQAVAAGQAGPFKTGQVVPWEDAVRILNRGETVLVGQTHDRWVFLEQKDGTVFETREPGIDVIISEIGACAVCGDIPIVTE